MNDLYIYIDETGKEGFFGSCAVLCEKEIEQALIERAMEDLRSARSLTDVDKRTLDRGHFHASKDSRAAIFSLARSIGQSLSAIVLYSHRKKGPTRQIEEEYRLHTISNIIEAMEIPSRLTIYFEERDQFKLNHAQSLEVPVLNFLQQQILRLPLYTCFYPNITWKPLNKYGAGAQVADLLLWTINNKVLDNPSNRFDASELFALLKMKDFLKGVTSPIDPNSANVESHGRTGRFLINRVHPYFRDGVSPYPDNVNLELSNDDCYQLFCLAEKRIFQLADLPLPPWAQHLTSDLQSFVKRYTNPTNPSIENLKEMASLFIRLFDTVPIYNGVRKDSMDFQALLRTRFMLAKLCYETRPTPIRMINYIIRRRLLQTR